MLTGSPGLTELARDAFRAIAAHLTDVIGRAQTDGESAPASARSGRLVAPPASTSPPKPAPSGHSKALLFVDGLAKETVASISGLRGLVAGPVMLSYLRDQALQLQAMADAGQQQQPGSVTRIPNSFQICGPGSPCDSFIRFRSNNTGHITDLAVDGQLLSGRLAVGASNTSSGLVLSSVYSYELVAK